jgi:gamma-glutamylcyclotransferase (GGCT)/AIG2-like uncharacterized protein YtfP
VINYYFAYGSNMNPARMRARGIDFIDQRAGRLPGFKLCFNKRASGKQNIAYANIGYQRDGAVEGVLYGLQRPDDIAVMDPFEGSPVRYSREVYSVTTVEGAVNAWVYVANAAMLAEGLLPEQNYLNHLLAGREWLSDDYYCWLSAQASVTTATNSELDGLLHNV